MANLIAMYDGLKKLNLEKGDVVLVTYNPAAMTEAQRQAFWTALGLLKQDITDDTGLKIPILICPTGQVEFSKLSAEQKAELRAALEET